MGLKANFALDGKKKEAESESEQPDSRTEFERAVVAAGAKGSFMVFKLKGEDAPFVESQL